MDYSGDLASIQQRLAASHDMDARRVAVLEALEAGPGDVVLEVGCGAGLCLSKIARTVAPGGRAIGIDVSADQIAAARDWCGSDDAGAPVELHVADGRDLPFATGEMDAVVSLQVLEYIDDIAQALSEIARVTRVGGRFVNVATTWGALYWSGGDAGLTRTVVEAWGQHCPYPDLPVDLPLLLRQHDFEVVIQRPVTIVNRRFHPNSFSWGAARLMAAFAESIGAIDAEAGRAWITSLQAADEAGSHFLSSVPILTIATRRR